jgi:hypothetical protein
VSGACPTCGHGKPKHRGPPSSRGAAPLAPEDAAFLRSLTERKSYSGEKLRQRMVKPCSASVFGRAKRGEKVSLSVQTALTELVSQLRSEVSNA